MFDASSLAPDLPCDFVVHKLTDHGLYSPEKHVHKHETSAGIGGTPGTQQLCKQHISDMLEHSCRLTRDEDQHQVKSWLGAAKAKSHTIWPFGMPWGPSVAAVGDERHCVCDCSNLQGLQQQHAGIPRILIMP